ncbi:site-specific DNA-methyltransferase [Pseudorhodoplanes sp.]|uniref:site-specific DNA-methyltransferase n=1 Tax=Pseudorhodoplanes sp. TaxID=1934341 RepID=UPI003D117A0C
MSSTPRRRGRRLVERTLSDIGRLEATHRTLLYVSVDALQPDPSNPRKHSQEQIRALALSIKEFGFNAPILAKRGGYILGGVGRWLAAKELGLQRVPVIYLDDLTAEQARAYMLADNQLAKRSSDDEHKLAIHLKELSELSLDFEIEATGFERPEIDFLIQSLDTPEVIAAEDTFSAPKGPAVARVGDLILAGKNRLYCGSALDAQAYDIVLDSAKASVVFSDPPYDVPIVGNVSGTGRHREFVMGSGEMTSPQFTSFLTQFLSHCKCHSVAGAFQYVCMDWRHHFELGAAGQDAGLSLFNLCVWVKPNGGMGSFYRSRHEFIFVFKNGDAPHINNVQLGRFGRNRTNVWNYPGANSFPRKGQARTLDLHPTVKPIAMVQDAILDSTHGGDLVLDPFLGSGTTLLAAERTGRRFAGIELDPLYVDTAIMRWEKMTGQRARLASSGKTFARVRAERGVGP